jgi:hypothetical protein
MRSPTSNPPASAGLFGAKGDSVEEKRAAIRKDRDEILAKLLELNQQPSPSGIPFEQREHLVAVFVTPK